MKSFFTGAGLVALALATTPAFAQMDAGRRALQLQNYNQAKQAFRRAANVAPPDNAEALYMLGETFYLTDRPDSARYYYERGANSSPKWPMNYVGLGNLLADQGNAAGANAQYANALKLGGKKNHPVKYRVAVAMTRGKNKNAAQAITYLNEAIAGDRKNVDYVLALGDAQLEKSVSTGNVGDALTSYENAISAFPNDARAYVRKAQLNKRIRLNDQVEPFLLEARKVDSNYAPLYDELAEYYGNTRRIPQGTYYYRKYLSLTENDRYAMVRYGAFLFSDKKYSESVNQFQMALAQDSSLNASNNSLYRTLGYAYMEMGDFDKGNYYLNRFTARNNGERPLAATDYMYMGRYQASKGNKAAAYVLYGKGVALDSTASSVFNTAGDSAFRAKNYKGVIEAYGAKYRFAPNTLTSVELGQLGASYYTEKMYANADSIFTTFESKYPTVPSGPLYRARANTGLDPAGNTGIAVPHYERYVALAETDAAKNAAGLKEAYKYLSSIYSKQGQTDKSAAMKAKLDAMK